MLCQIYFYVVSHLLFQNFEKEESDGEIVEKDEQSYLTTSSSENEQSEAEESSSEVEGQRSELEEKPTTVKESSTVVYSSSDEDIEDSFVKVDKRQSLDLEHDSTDQHHHLREQVGIY